MTIRMQMRDAKLRLPVPSAARVPGVVVRVLRQSGCGPAPCGSGLRRCGKKTVRRCAAQPDRVAGLAAGCPRRLVQR